MSGEPAVAGHYTHGALLAAIREGLEALGKTPETVSVEDLAPVDEFHIGGRQASEDFLSQLPLDAEGEVLDVGCGLGGASRFTASRFGCRVIGIDLTTEYVETGRTLCEWVGLDDRIALHEGSALDMPFDDAGFDAAYMMHVGMNIADKESLFAEVFRVLRPGATFGVYDVMRLGEGELVFPVPWASTAETSAVAAPEAYKRALAAAGFAVTAERNRRDFALDFFAELRARIAAAGGPPPLGLHVLMGASGAEKIKNMVENIGAGRIAPVEIIARK
ncbi:MAG: methyltransferase domain-containing protein [Kiloniellales bacterium]|nr:methyltransferase domain-containing protein [Kiloniellales bacterium]